MCGIAGIIRFKGSPLVKRKELPILKKMASTLRFRGPDDEEVVFDPEVAFVFRRLSIIDLAGGRQPFETKRLLVMCNGEIYNYKDLKKRNPYPYTSQSDCEVILPPGSRLIVDLKKETLKEEKWWELKFPHSKKDKRSANELIQEYGSLKVPLYYGLGQRYAFRTMYELMAQNDFSLLKESILDSKNKKNYIKLLDLIDSKKSLNTILKSVGIPLESVLPDLEEALEYGVLQIVN